MTNITKPYPLNAFRLCVDEVDTDIQGRVFSPLCDKAILFSGIGELLLKADRLFDQAGYPQAFQDKRSFGTGRERANSYRGIPEAKSERNWILDQQGKKGTYDILVESRRNTSWQGTITDAADGRKAGFDGDMELLQKLMKLSL